MKKNKLIPIAALGLCACFVTGCTPSVSSGNALLDAINALPSGVEIKKKQIDKIFKANILSASDKNVKKTTYREDYFFPYWWYGKGYKEEIYSEYVKESTRTRTYQVFDNEVVHTSDYEEVYQYDPDMVDPNDEFSDGISRTVTNNKGDAYIYHDNDREVIQYTFIDAVEPESNRSFQGSIEFNAYNFDKITHDGGLGAIIAQAKEDVEDQYNSFASQVSSWEHIEEYSAIKDPETGELKVSFTGDLCMPLYSGEVIWGWTYDKDDDDYKHPISRTEDNYDHIYVDRRIRTHYEFTIDKNAIITKGVAAYMMYCTTFYYDQFEEFTVLNGKLSYPLKKSIVDALNEPGRLIIPETVNGKPNPTLVEGYEHDTQNPYNVDYFIGSGESQGDYALTDLPDYHNYRKIGRMTDKGAWIDAYDLIVDN